jgi:hypothetical protein
VNSDADREGLQKVMRKKHISWRSFWDESTDGPISRAWNVTGWPTNYVIDYEGVIRHKKKRGESLDRAIGDLLVEMGYEIQVTAAENPIDVN